MERSWKTDRLIVDRMQRRLQRARMRITMRITRTQLMGSNASSLIRAAIRQFTRTLGAYDTLCLGSGLIKPKTGDCGKADLGALLSE